MPGDFVELEARRLSYIPTIPLFFGNGKDEKGKAGGRAKNGPKRRYSQQQ